MTKESKTATATTHGSDGGRKPTFWILKVSEPQSDDEDVETEEAYTFSPSTTFIDHRSLLTSEVGRFGSKRLDCKSGDDSKSD